MKMHIILLDPKGDLVVILQRLDIQGLASNIIVEPAHGKKMTLSKKQAKTKQIIVL